MGSGRPQVGVQRSVDDLGNSMRQRVEDVLAGSSAGRIVLGRGGWAIEVLLETGCLAAPTTQQPREHVSAGVAAGPGTCSQVYGVGPAYQTPLDERWFDLELAGVVLNGLCARRADRPGLAALSCILGDDASAAPTSSPASRGALEQIQCQPHRAGIGAGSRRWLQIGHGREQYHGPENHDTVTVRFSRMEILGLLALRTGARSSGRVSTGLSACLAPNTGRRPRRGDAETSTTVK